MNTNTNNTNRFNINDAIAQANRRERALNILEEGYTFTQENDMVAVCKPGELHASYWIGEHVDSSTGCDCPDRVKTGKPCKHEIANDILQADEAHFEAMAQKWENEQDDAKFVLECAIDHAIRF